MKNPSGIKVKSNVKAGGLSVTNHNRRTLKVRTGIKATDLSMTNHNAHLLAL